MRIAKQKVFASQKDATLEDHFPLLMTADLYASLTAPLPPKIYWHIQGNGGDVGKQKEDDSLPCDFITVVRQDYFV